MSARSPRRRVGVVVAIGALAVPVAVAPGAHAASHRMTVAGLGSKALRAGRSRRVPHIAAIQRPKDHTAVLAGSSPATAATVPAGTPAGTRRPLPAAVPGWADHDAAVGRVTPSQTIPVSLTLGWRDQAALSRLIGDVTNPSSSSYGQYLTPAAFRDRFSPTSQTVAAVTGYLASTGLTVDGVSRNAAGVRYWP
jgi:hypothetical protein